MTLTPLPAALSIDDGDYSHPENDFDPNLPPLDEQVLTLIRNAPNLTVRPARLTSELGLSIEDSSAELCGLMSAVGSTATFRFVTDADALTMEFTFPDDFERRARASRRKNNAKLAVRYLVSVALKGVKVVVAFGLVVSLAVIAVFAVCTLVAVIVALSRSGGNDHGRRRTTAMLRVLFRMLRDMVMIYAIFGPREEDDEYEYAGLTWRDVVMLCFWSSNPFIWMRIDRRQRNRYRHMHSRHRSELRSWGGSSSSSRERAELWEGNRFNREENNDSSPAMRRRPQLQQRGILSIAVEFLFGPTPFFPGPSEREKWKMRQRVLVTLSSSSKGEKDGVNDKPGVSLAQILPYVDHPPPPENQSSSSSSSISDVTEALKIVSHFNGVPVKDRGDQKDAVRIDNDMAQSRFVFPELMSEEESVGQSSALVAVSGTNERLVAYNDEDDDRNKWDSFLHINPNIAQKTAGEADGMGVPMYLKESRHVLTRLTSTQFGQCILLNVINASGIIIFRKMIEPGKLLWIRNPTSFAMVSGLLRFLLFYAILFFVLPFARMVYILCLNLTIEKRNSRRRDFAVKGDYL